MDTKYLNYILTIARERNLHRAAEKLFISQPSLSQYLTKLEAELGTPLFKRTSKELLLTEAGRLYVDTAQTVVDLRNKLYRDIANLSYQDHLAIATTSHWGMEVISQALPSFKIKHPDVMIEITESFFPSMTQRLRNREVDICLASVINPELDYEIMLLGEEKILMALSSKHPFCQKHESFSVSITPEILLMEFLNEPFLFTTKGSTTQTLIESWFQSLQFYPRIFGYFDNIDTILKFVANGLGISFVPYSCISADEKICYYPLENEIARKHIIAYRKDLPFTETLSDLLEFIQEIYDLNITP